MAIFIDNDDVMTKDELVVPADASSWCDSVEHARHKANLQPLRTVLENCAGSVTVEVHVVKVPLQSANNVLNAFRERLGSRLGDFQHLRRFARRNDLPASITSRFEQTVSSSSSLVDDTSVLYLLIGPLDASHVDELRNCLATVLPEHVARHACLHVASVPLLAPTSQRQADAWSSTHWPTVYKKSNPFGPHPSVVARAEAEMSEDVAAIMSSAAVAGRVAATQGLGQAIGAVVVDRSSGMPQILAVAADARWSGNRRDGPGNVMGHAALRAIGMVARRLLSARCTSAVSSEPAVTSDVSMLFEGVFVDTPLVETEEQYAVSADFFHSGYLCHGLEIYMTHEPCVMCSMALLHSRFVRVVFGHPMPATGGLSSEVSPRTLKDGHGVAGHGLFWREELNWSMLAWQYDMDTDASAVPEETDV